MKKLLHSLIMSPLSAMKRKTGKSTRSHLQSQQCSLRAHTNIFLVELELAELDAKKVLELNPDNRDVKSVYKLWKEKVREYNRKDAQFYGNIFAKMKTLEQVEATDTPARRGGVRMAIERLKRVLPLLSGKDLQTAAFESNDGAVHSANRARALRVWLISLLTILVAVYWSVFKKK